MSGFIGVLIFSGSMPATRVAVLQFDPVFLTAARASIAGLLALLLLRSLGAPRPARRELFSFLIVALGVVVGFPLLTAFALRQVTSAHSMIFIGLMPLMTAIFGVVRGGERPRAAFWLFAVVGSLAVAGYALIGGGSVLLAGDGLLLAAIAVCGLGYAEGARLARTLGGWQVISWALVFSLPVMLPLAAFRSPSSWGAITFSAWLGLGYVSLFSMLIGFIFWYRGLAKGGIAAVGQLQLLQPFLGLILSAALLGESVTWAMLLVVTVIISCVFGAKKFVR